MNTALETNEKVIMDNLMSMIEDCVDYTPYENESRLDIQWDTIRLLIQSHVKGELDKFKAEPGIQLHASEEGFEVWEHQMDRIGFIQPYGNGETKVVLNTKEQLGIWKNQDDAIEALKKFYAVHKKK